MKLFLMSILGMQRKDLDPFDLLQNIILIDSILSEQDSGVEIFSSRKAVAP
jgi:hypothetical protein